jgi:hypothetical protein
VQRLWAEARTLGIANTADPAFVGAAAADR